MTWIINAALVLLLTGCASCFVEPVVEIDDENVIGVQLHCPF